MPPSWKYAKRAISPQREPIWPRREATGSMDSRPIRPVSHAAGDRRFCRFKGDACSILIIADR